MLYKHVFDKISTEYADSGKKPEARPKGPSAFAALGGRNKWLSKKVSSWS